MEQVGRKLLRPIHDEQRSAIQPNVPGIMKKRNHSAKKFLIITWRVILHDQDLMFLGVPSPGPILVGPTQAKGHITFGIGQHVIEGSFQQPLARKPVIMVTKTVYSVFLGKRYLLMSDLP